MILFPVNLNQTYAASPISNEKKEFKRGYKCSVLSCNSYSGTNLEYAFFSFPNVNKTPSNLLDEWVDACNNPALVNRDPTYLHRCRRICSKHFHDHLIQKGRLVTGAIPTLCLGKEDIRRDHCYAQVISDDFNEIRLESNEIYLTSNDSLQEHFIGDANIGNTLILGHSDVSVQTSVPGCSKATQTESVLCQKANTWSTQTQTCKRLVGKSVKEMKLERRIKRLLGEIRYLEKELVDEKRKNGPSKQETLTIQFV